MGRGGLLSCAAARAADRAIEPGLGFFAHLQVGCTNCPAVARGLGVRLPELAAARLSGCNWKDLAGLVRDSADGLADPRLEVGLSSSERGGERGGRCQCSGGDPGTGSTGVISCRGDRLYAARRERETTGPSTLPMGGEGASKPSCEPEERFTWVNGDLTTPWADTTTCARAAGAAPRELSPDAAALSARGDFTVPSAATTA